MKKSIKDAAVVLTLAAVVLIVFASIILAVINGIDRDWDEIVISLIVLLVIIGVPLIISLFIREKKQP